ncbi:MAG TPA: twin-arginine translocase TatA/TatE family subunit [Alphaproteobacteria bacterium]|nr:twin-arginine translocase TatA/TatE family subunit [Alphaproteobacteria bacterium]
MGMSFSHLLLLLVIVLIVFGAGKLPHIMGDLAKGVRAFKDGLKESQAEDANQKALLNDDSNTKDAA